MTLQKWGFPYQVITLHFFSSPSSALSYSVKEMAPKTFPHYHLFNCKTGLINGHSQKLWALGLGSLAPTWPLVTGCSSLLCFYSARVKFILQPTERSSPGWLIGANCALSPGPPPSLYSSVCRQTAPSPWKPSSWHHVFHEAFPDLSSPRQRDHFLPRAVPHGGHSCTMTVLLHVHLSRWMIRSLGERIMFYTISNPGLTPNRCSVNSCRISFSPFPMLICI